MSSIINFFLKNRLFGDLVTLFTIFLGIYSITQIQREVFPNVNFDVITVETILPGASPEEMEKLVTNMIEQDMKEVDGIKRLQSYSTESRSFIVAFLDPDQTTEAQGKSDIQDVVDLFTPPDQAERPKVLALQMKQQPIIEVTLSSETPEMELRLIARDLEKKIEAVSGVARVVFKGYRDLEVRIQADPRKLARNSVSLDELVHALRLQNMSIPAGKLDPDKTQLQKSERIVRTIGEFETLEDIENTVLRATEFDHAVRVKDVAEVFYDLEEASVLNRANGNSAITLTVLKKETADAIQVVNDVKQAVEEYRQKESKFSVSYINDYSSFIKNRLAILSSNLFVGLILVCLILTLFLPFRIAFFVGLGILFSFCGCMILFYFLGQSVNLISLLGLIIVCGLLVDDVVIVSDNIARHMQNGLEPQEAAYKGTMEIWPAVVAVISTTIVAFMPMMFMSGIFGKVVQQIPIGVILALLVSAFEALTILPVHIGHYVSAKDFIKPKSPRGFQKIRWAFTDWWDNRVTVWYTRAVSVVVKYRYRTVIGLAVGLVASVMLATTTLKFVLFPPEGIEIFYIRAKAPTGTTLEETVELIKPIEQLVAKIPPVELQDYTATVGLIQQDPNDPNTKRGAEYAQIMVLLTPEPDRDRTAAEIMQDIREQIGTPDGIEEIWYDRLNTGPPVGKPISLGVSGQNYDEILPAVNYLKEKIAGIEGASDISDTHVEGKPEVHIKIKGPEAASAGLNVASIGNTMRAAIGGVTSTTIKKLDEEIDVRVILDNKSKSPMEIVSDLSIPNNRGNLIPLLSVADLIETKGVALFEHLNGQRVVKVQGNVDVEKISAIQANAIIRSDILPEVQKQFPNLSFSFGGEDEDTQESLASLGQAFLIAFLGIFLILILVFKNIYQPFLVMLTVPVGIVAVLLTLIVFRMPLSFMSLLGVIALTGVIVNNAIVLIDFVNQQRAQGLANEESIIEGARIRLRPIFLTTITTVVGLLPTAHGIGGLDMFVVPIALSLGYGMLIGSIINVMVFPAAIAISDDIRGWFVKTPEPAKT